MMFHEKQTLTMLKWWFNNIKPMTNVKLMVKLKKWLKNDGNTQVKLAKKLNYKSGATISQWLARGKIPRREMERVGKVLE